MIGLHPAGDGEKYRTSGKGAVDAAPANGDWLQRALEVAGMEAFCYDVPSGGVSRRGSLRRLLGLPGQGNAAEYFARIHPEDRDTFLELIARLSPAQPRYRTEYRVGDRGGSWHWFAESAEGSFDAAGRLVKLVGVCHDVTATRAVQEELERSETELRAVFDTLADGVVLADPDGALTDWNAAALRMHGFAGAAECTGPAARIAHLFAMETPSGTTLPASEWPLARVLAGEVVRGQEIRVTRRDQNWSRILRYNGSLASVLGSDTPIVILGISDVTQTHQAEAALREREQSLAHVLAATRDALWDWSVGSDRVRHNPQWCRELGLGENCLLHPLTVFAERIHDEDRPRVMARVESCLNGEGPYCCEFRLRCADGSYKWVLDRGDVVERDEHQRAVRMVGSFRDITPLKQAEAAMAQALRDSEQAHVAKSTFIANMSHEMRTPMHAILGFAELGGKKTMNSAPPEKIADYFARIHSSAQRLLHLLNDLLDLAKLEAGMMAFQPAPIDLPHLLQLHVDELQPLLQRKTIAVDTRIADGLPPVAGDPVRIGQVITNVLANAIRFSPTGGTLFLGIDQTGGGAGPLAAAGPVLRLCIADQGCGIPPGEEEQIFDKFIQSSRTASGAGGTGLGLAICREILAFHHGCIHAANQPQGGAIFTILLPANPPAGAAPAGESA